MARSIESASAAGGAAGNIFGGFENDQPIGKTQDAMIARLRESGVISKRAGEPSVKAVAARKELAE